MVLVLNAVLYVIALSLSLAVLAPVAGRPSRRLRLARAGLACGGGLAMSVAIVLSFMGHWFASGIAGCVSIAIVTTCLWFALTPRLPRSDDDDDGDDGGGGPRKRPEPPAPPEPAGGPSDDLWADFDRLRAGWERERAGA